MKEDKIRKREVLNKYLRLVEKDTKKIFDFKSFVYITCPACGSKSSTSEFLKNGFKYVSCKKCFTLFVNPRPSFKDIERFYSYSKSTCFWVNKFFKPVAEIRRKEIFKPRAEYIAEIIRRKNRLIVGDIGAGFGIFLEELRNILPSNQYIAIEPSYEMATICSNKHLLVRQKCLEDIATNEMRFDVLTAFELIEHLYDPRKFFKKVHSLLKPNGYFFMTTLNVEGFDVAFLWDKSKSVMPPHHLNFLNPRSIKYLLEKNGFKIVEISTPGQLDWDIVEGMIKNERIDAGRFWNSVAYNGSKECKMSLQHWISDNNLSSHMRIIAKK